VGIFDHTHLRWFSLSDAVDLAASAGFVDVDVELQFWDTGRKLHAVEALSRTAALRPYLAAQHILTARKQ
jgi:hypothetical protein